MKLTRRGGIIAGLVAPFVLLPLLARLAIRPIGDAMASAFGKVAPAPSSFVAAAPARDVDDEDPAERRSGGELAGGQPGPRRVARWAAPVSSSSAQGADAGTPKSGGTIVVPASAIEKAIQNHHRPSVRDVVDADGKPFGVKLHGVSRFKTGVQDGDVVLEVAGTRVHSTSELTQAGMSALAGGATKISGKILRGDTTYDVVVELPKQPPG